MLVGMKCLHEFLLTHIHHVFLVVVATVSFCCSFRLMPKWIWKEMGNVIYPTKRKYPPKNQLLVCLSFWMMKSFPHYDILVLSDNQQIQFEVITGAATFKKWNALIHKVFRFCVFALAWVQLFLIWSVLWQYFKTLFHILNAVLISVAHLMTFPRVLEHLAPLSEASWELPAELPDQQELLILQSEHEGQGKAADEFFMDSLHTWWWPTTSKSQLVHN